MSGRRRPKLDTPIDPLELQLGQVFAIDGIRFKCVGQPRVSPHDAKYVLVPAGKWGFRRDYSVPVGETVKVAAS